MSTIKTDMTKVEQDKSFVTMIVVAIGAIVWVGVSTFLFANLCSSIF